MAALSLDKIEAIAPDQASLSAARKLLKPGLWSRLAGDGAGLLWGECQGSGATPYRVTISEPDTGYKCTCPSRKFPCKHALGLMWLRAEGKAAFETSAAPEWVLDWVRRRRPADNKEPAEPSGDKSIALASREEAAEADPKAEARTAAARERTRKDREEAIAAGLDDLDHWITDQVEAGLAGFPAQAGKACHVIAQRMVDAKAASLASRLEILPPRLYALAEPARPQMAVRELGQLHVIAQAYRRQEKLSADLLEDVRRAVGWIVTREALLSDEAAMRASGSWRVVATLSEVQPDRLRRVETWFLREAWQEGPQFAVLVDFVPVATSVGRSPYLLGERLGATFVFYRSPAPLRAVIATIRSPAQESSDAVEFPDQGLAEALRGYHRALAAKPWIGAWPIAFRRARVRRSGEQLFVCAGDGPVLPVAGSQFSSALPLVALQSMDAAGLWDGTQFQILVAETALGRWAAE
ncbi:SWIM zinc finger family protein [Occallatibacter riparius]|uniref:SWIM zinc finger domain-containing protein n=1 Tax=Occallatibacter riparius TaxID=1002689 RepID=A0A9J7BVD3_9BACT|nr:SWIM zinc finger family protein [Occallatibacter riparius]UWZ86836.1 SWIM zinc finger domain-containing protein [Occallatibacter riparius]